MIEHNMFFEDFDGHVFAWVPSYVKGADLAVAAEYVLANNMGRISAAPDAVASLWPWLEKTNTDIIARFVVEKCGVATRTNTAVDLSARINSAFRSGAAGTQVFMPVSMLGWFVDEFHAIREDLFFNRELSIGMDLSDIAPCDWPVVFENLKSIKASSVIFAFADDAGDKSDFVGRVYGMLDSFDNEFEGDVLFAPMSDFRVQQVLRLVKSMRPELCNRIGFFIAAGRK